MPDRDIDLFDTKIAFAHLTDYQLARLAIIFKLMNHPIVNKVGSKLAIGMLKLSLPIEGVIKETLFSVFVGGQNLEEAQSVCDQLNERQISAILDYSVEHALDDQAVQKAFAETMRNFQVSADKGLRFVVFKVSAFIPQHCLTSTDLIDRDQKLMASRIQMLEELCQLAQEKNLSILIDAEQSWVQDRIDAISERLASKYNRSRCVVYVTVQMYRKDRFVYLKTLADRAQQECFKLGVKLVRGAYTEQEHEHAREVGKPSPVFETKEATDKAYNDAVKFAIANHIEIFVGSHNAESTYLVIDQMATAGYLTDDQRVTFGHLLGMGDNLSYNLKESGYNVFKLVPYGPVRDVIPYLVRRSEENQSIAGQVSRELKLIEQERTRRRQ